MVVLGIVGKFVCIGTLLCLFWSLLPGEGWRAGAWRGSVCGSVVVVVVVAVG